MLRSERQVLFAVGEMLRGDDGGVVEDDGVTESSERSQEQVCGEAAGDGRDVVVDVISREFSQQC